MGTRLLLTQECPLHPKLKEALLGATELDTRLVLRTVNNTHRVWDNQAARRCLELEAGGAELAEILRQVSGERAREMYQSGDTTHGIISCGQAVGLAHDLPSVAELFDRLAGQACQAIQGLGF